MRQNYKGRYADDFGGNHLDRLRRQGAAGPVLGDLTRKVCAACGQKKPIKGSKKIGKRMVCADCWNKTDGAKA